MVDYWIICDEQNNKYDNLGSKTVLTAVKQQVPLSGSKVCIAAMLVQLKILDSKFISHSIFVRNRVINTQQQWDSNINKN